MSLLEWQEQPSHHYSIRAGQLEIDCQPLQGLSVQAETLKLPQLLGLEIVDAVNLGPQALASPGTLPEVTCRQDTLIAQFAPTTRRPVECQARWRVLPEGLLDLEISTLTPGKWDDLAVQTVSRFPMPASDGMPLHIDETVSPGIVIYRPEGEQVSYIEFCHPHDGISLDIQQEGNHTTIRYRLFGLDLEKGVILRGRLRGQLVPRVVDVAAARSAYARFIAEPPNLTL